MKPFSPCVTICRLPAYLEHNTGFAESHGLKHGHSPGVGSSRGDEDVGAPVVGPEIVIGDGANLMHDALESVVL